MKISRILSLAVILMVGMGVSITYAQATTNQPGSAMGGDAGTVGTASQTGSMSGSETGSMSDSETMGTQGQTGSTYQSGTRGQGTMGTSDYSSLSFDKRQDFAKAVREQLDETVPADRKQRIERELSKIDTMQQSEWETYRDRIVRDMQSAQ